MTDRTDTPPGKDLGWQTRVFDSLSYPAIILKPDKTLVCANKKFYDFYDLTPEDIEGKECYSRFLYRGTPCTSKECSINRVLESKEKYVFTIRHQNLWQERIFSPIFDDSGNVEYILATIRDISRVKALEKKLTGFRDYISQVIHSSASAIVAADWQGNIELMNDVAKDLFKINGHEKTISHTKELYPPGKAKEIMKMLRDESIGGKGKLIIPRLDIVDSYNQLIPVEMSAAIIYDEDGNEAATMAIYNSLEEKIEVEEKLKEAQKKLAQSEKMASVGKLAAGVAHEINNPLTGILFYGSLLKDRQDLPDDVKEDLDYILEDANRCKDIVRSLLVYSRHTDSEKSVVFLNEVVEKSLKLTRDQKIFRNITLNKQFSKDPLPVKADSNKLSQVIINLVINAVDAMQGSGTLTLRTYPDTIEKKALLEVKDTGEGIPHENLSKIFDPFFTTKEVGKSTGLGLSIVYGIIEEHGGDIFVKNTGAKGTTFIVELPLCQSDISEGFLCKLTQ